MRKRFCSARAAGRLRLSPRCRDLPFPPSERDCPGRGIDAPIHGLVEVEGKLPMEHLLGNDLHQDRRLCSFPEIRGQVQGEVLRQLPGRGLHKKSANLVDRGCREATGEEANLAITDWQVRPPLLQEEAPVGEVRILPRPAGGSVENIL